MSLSQELVRLERMSAALRIARDHFELQQTQLPRILRRLDQFFARISAVGEEIPLRYHTEYRKILDRYFDSFENEAEVEFTNTFVNRAIERISRGL